MGVHESQSLLWERMVALSLPFSSYLAPKLTAAFPQLANLQVSPLHFHVVILSFPLIANDGHDNRLMFWGLPFLATKRVIVGCGGLSNSSQYERL